MLAVHCYKIGQEKFMKKIDERSVSTQYDDANLNRETSQAERSVEKSTSADEVFMLPVEDILQITYKTDVKRSTDSNVNSETIPEYQLSENICDRCCMNCLRCCDCLARCCDVLKHCCDNVEVAPVVKTSTSIEIISNPYQNVEHHEELLPLPPEKSSCFDCCDSFRCWCCRKKTLVRLIKRTKKTNQQDAERVITVTIEYLVYSNLDSPSNVRLLNEEEQKEFFKERFQSKQELQFYLTHNRDVDSKHFELRSKEAEALCRSIIQLKAMNSSYPSDNDLDKVLDQVHRRTFGDHFK